MDEWRGRFWPAPEWEGNNVKQTQRTRKNVQALIGAVVVAVLAAFSIELSAGRVPIPADYVWCVPLILAAISAATPQLRGLFSAVKGEEPAEPKEPVTK